MRIWKIILLVVIILVLLGGGVVGAFAAGVFKTPEVVSASHSWGEVTETSTTIVTDLVIDNPNPVGIALSRASVVVELRFNDVLLGRAESEGIELGKGQSVNRVVTRIDNTEIPEWWASHITAGENTAWSLDVSLDVSIFGRSVTIPVTDESGAFSTHMVERINAYQSEPLGLGNFYVQVTQAQFSWTDVSTDQSTLTGTISLHNSTPVSLNVAKAEYSLTMNGIEIAAGESAEDIQIESDEVNTIPLSFTLDHSQVLAWWPTHINNGEQSSVDLEVALTIAGNLPEPIGRLEVDLPVISVTETLQTDLLRQSSR